MSKNVALDVFRDFPYPKDKNEQTAWLSMLRQNPEEVLAMFSEALKILDQNTVKYMIDDMKATIQEKDAEIAALKRQLSDLSK